MGYQRPETAYKLNFAGTDLDGLEVTAKSLPIGEFLKLADLASAQDDPKAAAANAGATFQVLANALVGWNLDDATGQPVPATYDGIVSCELDFIMKIVNAWLSAMTAVDDSLGKDSSSGGTSGPVPPLPMEPLSPPQPS